MLSSDKCLHPSAQRHWRGPNNKRTHPPWILERACYKRKFLPTHHPLAAHPLPPVRRHLAFSGFSRLETLVPGLRQKQNSEGLHGLP
ncbi:uncharacterized protein VTP21DRAFT_9946 [Calcarisporiella thermophila]|uniref:uncharacterized protein n=1 Tax=Calcarisporiella thermophila TaxID=911321 RepID=UPI00374352B4